MAIIIGNSSGETLNGTSRADLIYGVGGDDTLNGNGGPDSLDGGSGDDTLNGGDGADTLIGGSGSDLLVGGDGNDLYSGVDAGDTIVELDGGGVDTVIATVSYTLSSTLENLKLVGGNLDGTGNDGDNLIDGTIGSNVLHGLDGDDVISADAGDDFVYGGDGDDIITGGFGHDLIYGGAGDDLVSGGFGDDRIIDSGGTNLIYGEFGNDVLEATDSAGGLFGDGGDDSITVTNTTNHETVVAFGGDGIDWIDLIEVGDGSAASGGDGNDMLRTYGAGSANVYLYGGRGDDTFYSARGGTTFDGGSGDDWISIHGQDQTATGGSGVDTYDFLFTTRGVITDFKAGDSGDVLFAYPYQWNDLPINPYTAGYIRLVQDGADVLVQVDADGPKGKPNFQTALVLKNVDGTQLTAHNLSGYSFTLLYQVSGDDDDNVLYSTSNGEMINGFGGVDTASYVDSPQGVTVRLTVNTQETGHGKDTLLSIENVEGSDFNDVLIGDMRDNTLWGRDGADALTAAGGNDSVYGGAGADTVAGGDGDDLLDGGADNDKLDGGNGADTLYGGSGDDELLGRAGVDWLVGDDGADRLDGGEGADVMIGGAGNDIYMVDNAADVVMETDGGSDPGGLDSVNSQVSHILGAYIENLTLLGSANNYGTGNTLANKLTGNTGNNVLNGGEGNDTLSGGAGDDTLIGGAGVDLLTGGTGADIFRFQSLADLNAGTDQITDFNVAQGDKLDFGDLDFDSATAGVQDHHFIGAAAFGHVAGELRFQVTGSSIFLQADINGDGVADFSLKLANVTSITADDIFP